MYCSSPPVIDALPLLSFAAGGDVPPARGHDGGGLPGGVLPQEEPQRGRALRQGQEAAPDAAGRRRLAGRQRQREVLRPSPGGSHRDICESDGNFVGFCYSTTDILGGDVCRGF